MGNFTNSPAQGLADSLVQGHIGVHFEEGTFLLERDLNLSGDLIRDARQRIFNACFANSRDPEAGNGFAITAQVSPSSAWAFNFDISAGSYLVNGLLVTNPQKISYVDQPGATPLTDPGGYRVDTIYLDVWIQETAPWPSNVDVGVQTIVAQSVVWAVRVNEANPLPTPGAGHHFVALAKLTLQEVGEPFFLQGTIDDLRATPRSLASIMSPLNRIVASLAPRIDSILSSDLHGKEPTRFVFPGDSLVISGENINAFNSSFALGDEIIESGGQHPSVVYAKVPRGARTGLAKLIATTDFGSASVQICIASPILPGSVPAVGSNPDTSYKSRIFTTPRGLDIAVCAMSAWLVGKNAGKAQPIYKWKKTSWEAVGDPINAARIGVGMDDAPWVITSDNLIFRLDGDTWTQVPGLATDIALGADGSVWKIGVRKVAVGYDLARWDGRAWITLPGGGGVRIAVDPDGLPWVLDETGHPSFFDGSKWSTNVKITATDIAIGASDAVIVGLDSETPTISSAGNTDSPNNLHYFLLRGHRAPGTTTEYNWGPLGSAIPAEKSDNDSQLEHVVVVGLGVDGYGRPWVVDSDVTENVTRLFID